MQNPITESYSGQELKVFRKRVTIGYMQDERLKFSKRLLSALERCELPTGQDAVGRLFGVSGPGARKWLKGDAMPNTKRIANMATVLGINGEWLLTGKGSMRPGDVPNDNVDSNLLREPSAQYVTAWSRFQHLLNKERREDVLLEPLAKSLDMMDGQGKPLAATAMILEIFARHVNAAQRERDQAVKEMEKEKSARERAEKRNSLLESVARSADRFLSDFDATGSSAATLEKSADDLHAQLVKSGIRILGRKDRSTPKFF